MCKRKIHSFFHCCPLKWQLQRYSNLSRVPQPPKGAVTQREVTWPHHTSRSLAGFTIHHRSWDAPCTATASPCLCCLRTSHLQASLCILDLHGAGDGPCHIPRDSLALVRRLHVFKEIMMPPMLELYQIKIRGRKKPMKTTNLEPVYPAHSPVEIQSLWQPWLKRL